MSAYEPTPVSGVQVIPDGQVLGTSWIELETDGSVAAKTKLSSVKTYVLAGAVGTGESTYIFNDASGQNLTMYCGTVASPNAVLAPVMKINRIMALPDDGGASDDGELLAALSVVSQATSTMVGQPVGIFAGARSSATTRGVSGRQPDALALEAIGEITDGGIGYGIGVFSAGRRSAATGNFVAMELQAENYSGVDGVYSSAGISDTGILWITAIGTADTAVGLEFGNPTGVQLGYAIAFTGQVAGGKTGGVKYSSIRDDSTSQIVLEGRGSHSIGVDLSNGTYSSYPIYLPNTKGIGSKNAAGSGSAEIAQLNAFDVVVLGTGANGIYAASTLNIGDAINVALGTTTGTKFGTATTQKIGFYNKTPIVLQTGVAVTAGGIHAALVNLGLITA